MSKINDIYGQKKNFGAQPQGLNISSVREKHDNFFSTYRELVEGKKKKASTKEKVGWQKDWVWTYWCKICLGPYIVVSNAGLKAWKVNTVV